MKSTRHRKTNIACPLSQVKSKNVDLKEEGRLVIARGQEGPEGGETDRGWMMGDR